MVDSYMIRINIIFLLIITPITFQGFEDPLFTFATGIITQSIILYSGISALLSYNL